jgi:hypothetical protein
MTSSACGFFPIDNPAQQNGPATMASKPFFTLSRASQTILGKMEQHVMVDHIDLTILAKSEQDPCLCTVFWFETYFGTKYLVTLSRQAATFDQAIKTTFDAFQMEMDEKEVIPLHDFKAIIPPSRKRSSVTGEEICIPFFP